MNVAFDVRAVSPAFAERRSAGEAASGTVARRDGAGRSGAYPRAAPAKLRIGREIDARAVARGKPSRAAGPTRPGRARFTGGARDGAVAAMRWVRRQVDAASAAILVAGQARVSARPGSACGS